MLAVRIIPVMLCRGRSLVKGKHFVNDRVVGHVLQAARTHAARGVDELMILDIAATAEGRGPDLEMIRELTADIFTPVTVGGGVRTLQQIDELLRVGADKVLIGAAAWEIGSTLVREATSHFGSQAVVVPIDYHSKAYWTAERMAQETQAMGAGEILLNNVDRDGTMSGYDLDLIAEVCKAVSVPVIACGGCSGYPDMLAAINAGASAVAAGALFQFEDATPLGAAQWLGQHGITVRL